MIIPGAASLSSLTLCIAGLQSYAQAVVTRGGRVGQVNFGETDENRQEAIHQFREKLESEDPHLLKSLPGTVEDHFLLKVLRAGTASGKQVKT